MYRGSGNSGSRNKCYKKVVALYQNQDTIRGETGSETPASRRSNIFLKLFRDTSCKAFPNTLPSAVSFIAPLAYMTILLASQSPPTLPLDLTSASAETCYPMELATLPPDVSNTSNGAHLSAMQSSPPHSPPVTDTSATGTSFTRETASPRHQSGHPHRKTWLTQCLTRTIHDPSSAIIRDFYGEFSSFNLCLKMHSHVPLALNCCVAIYPHSP